jgi:hypothetical protein
MNDDEMTHEQAVKADAVVRYLLKEMSDEEYSAFEGHYADCRECYEQVQMGMTMAEAAVNLPAPPAAPGFFSQLAASFRQPASAILSALLVAAIGFNLHQRSLILQAKVPIAELRYMVKERSHGDETVTVPRNTSLSLGLDYQPNQAFVAYEATIVSDQGAMAPVRQLKDQEGIAYVLIPANAVKAGTYSMIVSGRKADGSTEQLRRGEFKVVVADK